MVAKREIAGLQIMVKKSVLQFYSYEIQMRQNSFNYLLRFRELFSQFIVGMACMPEYSFIYCLYSFLSHIHNMRCHILVDTWHHERVQMIIFKALWTMLYRTYYYLFFYLLIIYYFFSKPQHSSEKRIRISEAVSAISVHKRTDRQTDKNSSLFWVLLRSYWTSL